MFRVWWPSVISPERLTCFERDRNRDTLTDKAFFNAVVSCAKHCCVASFMVLLPFRHSPFFFYREEAQITARLRGEDGKLVVRHYSGPRNKIQHSRHQRFSTFPLPTIFSKLPPSLSPSSTHAPSAQEEVSLGKGLRLFLIVLPDRSGFCKLV